MDEGEGCEVDEVELDGSEFGGGCRLEKVGLEIDTDRVPFLHKGCLPAALADIDSIMCCLV